MVDGTLRKCVIEMRGNALYKRPCCLIICYDAGDNTGDIANNTLTVYSNYIIRDVPFYLVTKCCRIYHFDKSIYNI